MGIDPVTHEPLNKEETKTSESSSHSDHSPNNHEVKSQETNDNNPSSEENSICSPAENLSNDESNLLSLCDDDLLMSCLWGDEETPIIDEISWDFPAAGPDFNNSNSSITSWDETCSWLLDCQDFGVQDFGVDCFNDVEVMMNTLNTIDMDKKY